MTAPTSQQIRQQFIDFFVREHGHTNVPSSPVVPHDDPTLLFTNAGMNQFKPYFLGLEKAPWQRVANTQKCIRAGGKHNDLDDVGRSRRHHTFFEMLGNWSFGDYFKQGAIEMAWQLLTKEWKLDPARIHVSCFEGNETLRIPRDTEAANIWKKVAGLTDDHIHYFGKDNFWEMGDTGPCGPCTEIYYDRTPDKTGGPQVNGTDPRVMEVWNLVFIQYNRDAAGKLTTLPSQHVDTGMGLERICQVLQDKSDNYGTDLFSPLFDAISKISNLRYTGLFPPTNAADPVAEAANPQLRHDIAFRVVADHIRCLTFALTDGAVPSNEGRGSVLRRILRRAVFWGHKHLGINDLFLHRLAPVVVETMGEAFPELTKDSARVVEIITSEEVSFGRTLDRGFELFLESAAAALDVQMSQKENSGFKMYLRYPLVHIFPPTRAGEEMQKPHEFRLEQLSADIVRTYCKHSPTITGEAAFKLHDTYGFPIDLTRIMAEERGMTVDIQGYEKLMEQAKELARAGGKEAESSVASLPPDALAELGREHIKATDDHSKYSRNAITATVLAIWNGESLGAPASVFEDEELAVILDKTNFYAEMGGQVGDTGELHAGSGAIFDVATTRLVGGYVLHIGKVRAGKLHVRDTVTATVLGGREQTEKNHTTTHLANWALREVLGDDVQQKGSLVDPEKLRFDFSHGKALVDEELAKVESLVNQGIERKMPVYAETAPQEKALKIHGLRAVFGEKYPPMVRVVSIGVPVADLLANPGNPKWREYSIEFCGGTHLPNASDAGHFTITAEESVSKGIRRIVGLTGEAAHEAQKHAKTIDALIAHAAKADGGELHTYIANLQKAVSAGTVPLRAKRRGQAAIAELQSRHKAWEKTQKSTAAASDVDAVGIAGQLLADAPPLGPGKLIVGPIPGANDEQLRAAIDSLKKKAGSYAILLGIAEGEKVSLVAAVSDDLIARGLKAGDWVKDAAKIAGGGGGGRPQQAMGSGKDPARLPDALAAAKDFATRTVK